MPKIPAMKIDMQGRLVRLASLCATRSAWTPRVVILGRGVGCYDGLVILGRGVGCYDGST